MVDDAARDRLFMERALFLAERGRGRTSPNPIVGAVVVAPDGVVVGQGAHLQAGAAHAEVTALAAAGERARGATLYCTLEPCSHTGRTGPCVERIVAAGIARVVAAVGDPNPRVAGAGFDYLRGRGVEVVEGVGREAALRQHAPFFTWVTRKRPFVIVKAAMSRDGFVGRADERVQITGPVANRYFQRQRAEIDAIAVGSGTVLTDNPLLTARGAYRARPLTRVVFDWRGRVPADAALCSTLDAGPVIMLMTRQAAMERPDHVAHLTSKGVVVQQFETRALEPALAWLASRDVVTLLVEGGPALHAALAEEGLIDRGQWVVSPEPLGSGVAVAMKIGRQADPAQSAPVTQRLVQLGNDVLFEFEIDVHRTDRTHRPH